MKIHGVKINKKNFWIPFLVSSVFSYFAYIFSLIFSFYLVQLPMFKADRIDISFFYFIFNGAGELFFSFSLITPIIIILTSIPGFFIIKRLLSKKPKKVFYFEFPILIIIYYLISSVIGGLMMLGGTGVLTILSFIIPIIIWLTLITISLYFYYKKFIFLRK